MLQFFLKKIDILCTKGNANEKTKQETDKVKFS